MVLIYLMKIENIKIIYEDENVVVINKPAGLVVHSDGKIMESTVVDWFLKKYPETENVGEPLILSSGEVIKRPGIVHRLDRETSGVLVIAKNQETFLNLKEQFQNRTIQKSYRAFVYGEIKNNEGIIDRPIGRSSGDFRKWSAQRGVRGKIREAVTEYRVLKRKNGYSFVEVNPKTGRTHQIRVHFKAINYPIVCDKLYASNKECTLGFERLALHAFSLEFNLPKYDPKSLKIIGQEKLKLEAELPEDFQNAFKSLE